MLTIAELFGFVVIFVCPFVQRVDLADGSLVSFPFSDIERRFFSFSHVRVCFGGLNATIALSKTQGVGSEASD